MVIFISFQDTKARADVFLLSFFVKTGVHNTSAFICLFRRTASSGGVKALTESAGWRLSSSVSSPSSSASLPGSSSSFTSSRHFTECTGGNDCPSNRETLEFVRIHQIKTTVGKETISIILTILYTR